MFDEQPDDPDPHGECAWTIRDLTDRLKDAEERADHLDAQVKVRDAALVKREDQINEVYATVQRVEDLLQRWLRAKVTRSASAASKSASVKQFGIDDAVAWDIVAALAKALKG